MIFSCNCHISSIDMASRFNFLLIRPPLNPRFRGTSNCIERKVEFEIGYFDPETRKRKSRSIGVVLSYNLKSGPHQYLYIKPKTPVVDVPQIKLHSFRDVLDRGRSTSGAVALSPAGYAWLDVVTKRVVAEDALEVIVVGERMRARPYK